MNAINIKRLLKPHNGSARRYVVFMYRRNHLSYHSNKPSDGYTKNIRIKYFMYNVLMSTSI